MIHLITSCLALASPMAIGECWPGPIHWPVTDTFFLKLRKIWNRTAPGDRNGMIVGV